MSSSVINLAVIRNPFEPDKDIVKAQLPYVEGQSLDKYMGNTGRGWVATVNSGIVEQDDWALTILSPNDYLVVSAIPYGGGGAKDALRLVAVITMSVYAPGLGTAFASSAFGTALGVSAQVATAGILIGGSVLINAIMPPAAPDINNNNDIKDSPTYGQDTASNTSESGIPIPLCYGGYRVGGNVISSYIENINDEQFLYVLYNAGEGEIDSISNIRINNQPASNFSEVTIESRMGTADQTAIGWFDQIRRPFNIGSIIKDDEWRTYTFRDLADKASIQITFAGGLFGVNESNGSKYSITVTFQIQYRAVNPNNSPEDNWEPIEWVSNSGSVGRSDYSISGSQSSPVRRTIKTSELGFNDQIEIRIRRSEESDSDYITDEATLAIVTEISTEKVRYKHTALVAARILMTEQLTNQPTITYYNGGIKVRTWDDASYDWIVKTTTNPAWIAFDILTNARYGASIPDQYIRLDKFKEWAKWCEDQDLTFNGVIDTSGNAFDSLEPVLRLGHAKLFSIGTRISVSVEKPDIPIMMFSQANMITDTFSIDWLPVADRANEIEVTFFDKDNNYESTAVKAYDTDSLSNNDPQRPSSFTLIGCVDERKAFYEALLAINYNKHIIQTYTFDASVDAIACTIGSVVYIQHDMPQWGYSGRLNGGNKNNSVIIDIDPDEFDKTPDIIMVHHDSLLVGSGAVSNRTNNVIRIEAVPSSANANRAIIGGADCAVSNIRIFPTYCLADIDESASFSIGEIASLYETDIYEERTIDRISFNEVFVTSPFRFVPNEFAQYLIGSSNTVKKKARILGIDYASDHVRSISAIEYNASIYDKDIPFTPSPIKPGLGEIENTELFNIQEELIWIGKNLRPRLTISYRNASSIYQTTQVFISVDGGKYLLRGTARREIVFESEDEAVLDIKLVAVSANGSAKALEEVSAERYVVLGKTAPPEDVSDFVITKEVGGIQLSWDSVSDLDLEGYEIRTGTSWGDGEIVTQALSSTVLFYPISVAGAYEFMIRAVDTSGNLSAKPSYANIDIIRPAPVLNFAATQHIDKVLMRWDRPVDRNITAFWIRQGESWDNSIILGSVTGTDFEVPAVASGSKTFWIKAVDIIGIDSEIAVFSVTNIAPLPYRNMIYDSYHGLQKDGVSYDASGIKLNVDGENPILMEPNVAYGEYTAELVLPYAARARNTSNLDVGVLVESSTTWDTATFTWDSPAANTGWAAAGDPEKIDFEQYISLKYSGAPEFYPNSIYLFSLDQKLTCDITGITPTGIPSGITYEPARYNYGVLMDTMTEVHWAVTTNPSWTVTTWMLLPIDLDHSSTDVTAHIKLDSGKFIYLISSPVTRSLIARESGYPDLEVKNFTPQPGDVVFIAVSQDKNERILRIKNLADNITHKETMTLDANYHPDYVGLGLTVY